MFLHGKPDPRSRSFNLIIGPPSTSSIPDNTTPISSLPSSAPIEYKAVKLSASNLSPGAQAIQIVPK